MTISNLYLRLIDNPHPPTIYRQLEKYYRDMKMYNEADAFRSLLINDFSQPAKWSNEDIVSNTDEK